MVMDQRVFNEDLVSHIDPRQFPTRNAWFVSSVNLLLQKYHHAKPELAEVCINISSASPDSLNHKVASAKRDGNDR
jgi:hypothetical protein